MSHIFLSHSSTNNAEAVALREWLGGKRGEDSGLRRRPSGIRGGYESDHEQSIFFRLCKRALQRPQCVPLRQCGRRCDAREMVDGRTERFAPEPPEQAKSPDKNYLFDDLIARLAREPLQWHLIVTIGQPGDATPNGAAAELSVRIAASLFSLF
jgi:hypothetical protein